MQWIIDLVLDSMSGIIVCWFGLFADIPAGWVACDGTNGTPDLRSRFVKATGSGTSQGEVGGSTTHAHAGDTTHQHNIPSGKDIASGTGFNATTGSPGKPGQTGFADTDPLYHSLWYIMKT